jgi:hypothetical protein
VQVVGHYDERQRLNMTISVLSHQRANNASTEQQFFEDRRSLISGRRNMVDPVAFRMAAFPQ